ncbi:MAG: hypothetical protein HQL80_02455 [Magnetococcales bacterium]|nr:hypothetical protein [Magnetococcales bacterium]
MRQILIASIMMLLLGGCATSGKEIKPEQLSDFKKGKTTVEEVVSKLGEPTTASLSDGGGRTLVYIFSHYQMRASSFIPYIGLLAGGADVRANSVVFTFGADGKMTGYKAQQSQFGVTSGLAAGIQGNAPQTQAWQSLPTDEASTNTASPESPAAPHEVNLKEAETVARIPATHAAQEASSPASTTDDQTEIEQTIRSWVKAWSSKNVEEYLAFYSNTSFVPEKFSSRGEWEVQRFKALRSANEVHITITDVKVLMLDTNHAKVTFLQKYRSNAYQDQVNKSLSLQKEDGAWKIVREYS